MVSLKNLKGAAAKKAVKLGLLASALGVSVKLLSKYMNNRPGTKQPKYVFDVPEDYHSGRPDFDAPYNYGEAGAMGQKGGAIGKQIQALAKTIYDHGLSGHKPSTEMIMQLIPAALARSKKTLATAHMLHQHYKKNLNASQRSEVEQAGHGFLSRLLPNRKSFTKKAALATAALLGAAALAASPTMRQNAAKAIGNARNALHKSGNNPRGDGGYGDFVVVENGPPNPKRDEKRPRQYARIAPGKASKTSREPQLSSILEELDE